MATHRHVLALVLASALHAGCGGDSTEPSDAIAALTGLGRWTTLGTRAAPSRPSEAVDSNAAAVWTAYDTLELHPGSVAESNVLLSMDDGAGISLNVTRPRAASGEPVAEPLPTIVTFTPYNKNTNDLVPLGGGVNEYLVRRGYNHVVVDVRGTGRSGGAWDPFSAREQQDYPQVLDWVVEQPWSNGVIGLWGISATATTSLLAASQGHPAVHAVFAVVPHGDVYRDLVFVGGQASAAFLPAWMSVVTLLATLNPSFDDQPEQYLEAAVEHLFGLGEFVVPRTVGVLTEVPETAFDGPYWGTKSPLELADGVSAPTFIVGGLFDIFQRGEPLDYEALKTQTTAKLLLGPWHHLEAATGEGLPREGVPPLDHIAARWFDHYLENVANGAESLPNVTQWVWGHEHFATSTDWPHPMARAERRFLRSGGDLSSEAPPSSAPPATVLQQPFNGVCSESSLQISLGLLGYAPLPCWYEDNLAQALEATFDTPPLEQDLYLNGPIQADLWISTTAANAGLVVRVSDLEPGGSARALTSGIQTASLRAVDESKSRYLDGEMIQPWHPFTAESVAPVGSGNVVEVPVEIFPTSALVRKGHRLRISVGASNFPFGVMPLPTLAESAAGVLSIYADAERPSSIVLPVVPAALLP